MYGHVALPNDKKCSILRTEGGSENKVQAMSFCELPTCILPQPYLGVWVVVCRILLAR